jgi:hypothetical protein
VDIANLRTVVCTVKRGRRHDRSDYRAEQDAKGQADR